MQFPLVCCCPQSSLFLLQRIPGLPAFLPSPVFASWILFEFEGRRSSSGSLGCAQRRTRRDFAILGGASRPPRQPPRLRTPQAAESEASASASAGRRARAKKRRGAERGRQRVQRRERRRRQTQRRRERRSDARRCVRGVAERRKRRRAVFAFLSV
uniref:Uncharacterized protein n=1 Tax=Toxoplasma gondii COUG TaxID=1074873 RepID=A0A2G8XSV5_TOXGO|nr:hypothetical protein TGCOUG_394920 [Toxoplasma gondii COUG]